jgi:hypothetical protein
MGALSDIFAVTPSTICFDFGGDDYLGDLPKSRFVYANLNETNRVKHNKINFIIFLGLDCEL